MTDENQNSNHQVDAIIARKIADISTACLRAWPPELSHRFGMSILKSPIPKHLVSRFPLESSVSLKCQFTGGKTLSHPVALAAGFDKNGECIRGLQDLGFSMLELGTVTPLSQPGNPKPRIFRDPNQRAIVNRLGFNNSGVSNLANKIRGATVRIPIGINLGKNKTTELHRAIDDYMFGLDATAGLGDYYVINVSSPNTPGLRDLATVDFIQDLGFKIRSQCPCDPKQVWIKLDPDSTRRSFQSLIEAIATEEFAGIILTNTHRVEFPESGGQSGHPLLLKATARLEWAHEVHRGSLAMIGCGGVMSGADIFQKMIRGAALVQIYTALIYRGPLVVNQLLGELEDELKLRGISFLQDVIGRYYEDPGLS